MKASRKEVTRRRHARIRRRVSGSSEKPRLAVFRSNQHIYAQIIDDTAQHTLVAASTVEPTVKAKGGTSTKEGAAAVGELLAKRAQEKGISQVVFDRGGKLYHGRVAALAEAAREAGLSF
jgi:large subunit ribosomal protein L18